MISPPPTDSWRMPFTGIGPPARPASLLAPICMRLKEQCDAYFHLPHRNEPRGIGGIFFDDYKVGGFDASFAVVRSLADSYLPAYLPLLRRRKDTPFGDRERAWQEVRRGRYVEFNLLHDRGTRYGLQTQKIQTPLRDSLYLLRGIWASQLSGPGLALISLADEARGIARGPSRLPAGV